MNKPVVDATAFIDAKYSGIKETRKSELLGIMHACTNETNKKHQPTLKVVAGNSIRIHSTVELKSSKKTMSYCNAAKQ